MFVVFDDWESVRSHNAINLFLYLVLDFWKDQQSQDITVQGGGRSIRASFQQRTADIACSVVGEILSFLSSEKVVAETRLINFMSFWIQGKGSFRGGGIHDQCHLPVPSSPSSSVQHRAPSPFYVDTLRS